MAEFRLEEKEEEGGGDDGLLPRRRNSKLVFSLDLVNDANLKQGQRRMNQVDNEMKEIEREEDEVSKVLGSRKTKAYKKMLERAGIPERALEFLPQMKPAEKYILGRQSARVYRRIGINYINKPKKRESIIDDDDDDDGENEDDNENEDDEDDDDDGDDEDESGSSDSESDSSSSNDEDMTSSEEEEEEEEDDDSDQDNLINEKRDLPFNKLEHVVDHQKQQEEMFANNQKSLLLLPKDEIRKSLLAHPTQFRKVDPEAHEIPEEYLRIGSEPIEPAIPGFAANKKGVSKSLGAESFFNYYGRWKQGHLEGDGIYFFADDGTHHGSFSCSKLNGKGIAKYPDGTIYTGNWVEGEKHDGSGVEVSPNGATYTGQFQKGERTGYGKLEMASGSTYEGDFENGQFHGRGKFKSRNGWSYEGNWVRGLILGSGAVIDLAQVRIVRTWEPARTFSELIHFVQKDRLEKRIRKTRQIRKLRQVLDDMDLQEYVARVRKKMKDEELAELQRQREELERLRRERREEKQKAKEALLKDYKEAKEAEREKRKAEAAAAAEAEEEEGDEKNSNNKTGKAQDSDDSSDESD